MPTGGAQSIAVTNGTVVIAANGSTTFKPNENFNGDISFDYVAKDADGDTDTATVSIKVAAQNDPVDAVNDQYEVNERWLGEPEICWPTTRRRMAAWRSSRSMVVGADRRRSGALR